jgi:hypothetical protein
MTRRALARAITASLWPWTEGRFEVWWLGSCVMAGHDEFLWSWNAEVYEAVGLTA